MWDVPRLDPTINRAEPTILADIFCALDQNWGDKSKKQRGHIAPIDQRRPGKTKETVWEVRLRPPKFL